ncbi:MAG: hypothetical protein Q9218_007694 [Villophora microphyllina]
MTPTLTLSPDIEFQSLDHVPRSLPQDHIGLERDHVHHIENREEPNVPMRTITTTISHGKTIVASKSGMKIDHMMTEEGLTNSTITAALNDQMEDRVTVTATVVQKTEGKGHEADLPHIRNHQGWIRDGKEEMGGILDTTDMAGKTEVREGMRKATAGFQQTSHSSLKERDLAANDGPRPEQPPLDEASLVEERRKKREAIKARYRGQATPLLVQALAIDHQSGSNSPKAVVEDGHQPASIYTAPEKSSKAEVSAPSTPKDPIGQDSPTALVMLDDKDLANSNPASNGEVLEDEPSAADYDPIMDMQEDRARQDTRQNDEVSAGAYDETATERQDILLPEASTPELSSAYVKDGLDMFADEDDMFAEAPVAPKVQAETAKAVPVLQSKTVDGSMLDDWDDHEGYYKVILGELLDGRYHVQSNLGKGMFSAVVRVTDQKTGKLAAIKIIRNNESMKKAGLKEVEILQKLAIADPEDKKHVIRLERIFEHKGHLCMVFENLSINLREVLKKFGRDVGINLKAVRAYAQQMFLGLSLLRKCNVLHADLKPDNVLVNESRNVLKICDLGSASDASDNEITPYLVSRFYRAPEIILGMPYDFGIDVWSVGCTLFELYTGKILFTGRSNNQMLRAIMECRGKFGHKMLRKAEFGRQHFDDLLNFRSIEKDKLTGKDVVRIINFTKPTRDLRSRLMANAKGLDDAEIKELYSFIDLLDRCLNPNPEKRCSPAEASKHPFITRAKV